MSHDRYRIIQLNIAGEHGSLDLLDGLRHLDVARAGVEQLKTVRHRQTPSMSLRISSRRRASVARVEDEAMALTIAAGPTYFWSPQNGGQAVVQQAQRMHLVVSSNRARSAGDWSRSVVGAGSSLTRNGMTDL